VRTVGLCQWKIPMTPSGIEPATSRLLAHCLINLLQILVITTRILCHCYRIPHNIFNLPLFLFIIFLLLLILLVFISLSSLCSSCPLFFRFTSCPSFIPSSYSGHAAFKPRSILQFVIILNIGVGAAERAASLATLEAKLRLLYGA